MKSVAIAILCMVAILSALFGGWFTYWQGITWVWPKHPVTWEPTPTADTARVVGDTLIALRWTTTGCKECRRTILTLLPRNAAIFAVLPSGDTVRLESAIDVSRLP